MIPLSTKTHTSVSIWWTSVCWHDFPSLVMSHDDIISILNPQSPAPRTSAARLVGAADSCPAHGRPRGRPAIFVCMNPFCFMIPDRLRDDSRPPPEPTVAPPPLNHPAQHVTPLSPDGKPQPE